MKALSFFAKFFNLIGVKVTSTRSFNSLSKEANPAVTDLLSRFGISCKSVLHIGGHLAEEAKEYKCAGFTQAVFVEGIPEMFERMMGALEEFPRYTGICALLSNKNEPRTIFYASNDGASTSILPPARHSIERPDITFTQSTTLNAVTLDSLNLGPFDLIVLDVQGAEALVLEGGESTVANAKAIWIEVNTGNMYENDGDSAEITKLLSTFFVPVYMNMNYNRWGNALFIQKIRFSE